MFWKKKPKFVVPELTDATFNEAVVNAEVPVLVDFYADWCGPCKVLLPIIGELAQEYDGKALVVKVNTQHNPALSQHFKIKSIPTLMVFNKGNFQERFQGLIPKPNLAEILDEYIAGTDEQGRLPAE
jgi:thioredoxin 1